MGTRPEATGKDMPHLQDEISPPQGHHDAVREPSLPHGDGQTISRVTVGTPNRVDRLKALGNAQVASVAAAAWHLLTEAP